MLQHFRLQPMYENTDLPGWTISFYYENQLYKGDYLPDGTIVWTNAQPPNEAKVKTMVHELMTFHVYE